MNIEPIKRAYEVISSEIRRRGLRGVNISITDNNWLQINLLLEERVLWIGHRDGSGYFMCWNRSERSDHFFHLDENGVLQILAMLPEQGEPGVPNDEQDVERAKKLLESINQAEPDAEQIRDLLNTTPSTERGIDLLAAIASIIKYRNAINKLESMIEEQDEKKHQEAEYRTLFYNNAWMLGSQYEALEQEVEISTEARVDLVLRSVLGYIDLVELKRPDTQILVERRRSRSSIWQASEPLSAAFAQARKYLKILDEQKPFVEKILGITEQSSPRMYRSGIVIVAGRTPETKDACDVLRDMNMSVNRILILTYDDIVAIGESIIHLLEGKLAPPSLPA